MVPRCLAGARELATTPGDYYYDQLFLLIGVGGTGPLGYLLGGFYARMWKVSFAALAERDLVNFPPRQVGFHSTNLQKFLWNIWNES